MTIGEAFDRRREAGDAALVVYTTAGFPDAGAALEPLLAIADAGADVIELGVPFSDPLADGPTIQGASDRAIAQGVDLAFALDLLRRFTAVRDTPVVVFSYLNPILRYGVDRFIGDAVDAGAGGVLITDLPAGADVELEDAIRASALDLVRLVAPTSSDRRVREVAESSSGFVYYVSRTGVTGARAELAAGLEAEIARVRGMAELPVAVGFGISDARQAAEVGRLADGVVVGSAVVDALGRDGVPAAAALVRTLRTALDGVRARAPAAS